VDHQWLDGILWSKGLFNVWIIIRTFPGEFPSDPEDSDAYGQSKRREEQIADFHERLILVYFRASVSRKTS